jgi:hypothetical protein
MTDTTPTVAEPGAALLAFFEKLARAAVGEADGQEPARKAYIGRCVADFQAQRAQAVRRQADGATGL